MHWCALITLQSTWLQFHNATLIGDIHTLITFFFLKKNLNLLRLKSDLWIWEDLKWFTQCPMHQSIFRSLDWTNFSKIGPHHGILLLYIKQRKQRCRLRKKMNEAGPDCISQQAYFPQAIDDTPKAHYFSTGTVWNNDEEPLAGLARRNSHSFREEELSHFLMGFTPSQASSEGKRRPILCFLSAFLNWFGNHEIAMWYQSQNKTGCFPFSLFNSWVWGQ